MKLNIVLEVLKYDENPRYLGVVLDRQLTFRKHLENIAAKVRTRNAGNTHDDKMASRYLDRVNEYDKSCNKHCKQSFFFRL